MKNITLSADESLIEAARQAARADNSSLNEQFRLWLESYARKYQAQRAMEVIDRVRGQAGSGGRKFTREEMNERR